MSIESKTKDVLITSKTTFDPRTIDICEYEDKKTKFKCEQLATVFITSVLGKKKYCNEHFSLILFKGK